MQMEGGRGHRHKAQECTAPALESRGTAKVPGPVACRCPASAALLAQIVLPWQQPDTRLPRDSARQQLASSICAPQRTAPASGRSSPSAAVSSAAYSRRTGRSAACPRGALRPSAHRERRAGAKQSGHQPPLPSMYLALMERNEGVQRGLQLRPPLHEIVSLQAAGPAVHLLQVRAVVAAVHVRLVAHRAAMGIKRQRTELFLKGCEVDDVGLRGGRGGGVLLLLRLVLQELLVLQLLRLRGRKGDGVGWKGWSGVCTIALPPKRSNVLCMWRRARPATVQDKTRYVSLAFH